MSRELATPDGLASHRFRAMGTEIHVLSPAIRALDALEAVRSLFAEWEDTLSRFRPESELSRLNLRAGTPVRVGPVLMAAVEAALEAARATGGLFDPTLRHELVRMGYDRPFERIGDAAPTAERARGGGGWRQIVVDRATWSITLPRGSGLDLGGIAKGMAVDAALELLARLGIEPALVSAGGDLAVLGHPPGRRAWHVLVGEDEDAPVVPLVRGALATSGVARRRWTQGGAPRHHLVDPRSGEPAGSGLREVTVAGPTCRAAEVGATAAFVAGPRLAGDLLRRLGLAGRLVAAPGVQIPVGRWPRPDLPHVA
jgi:thiamine biosynthesis lipoprotein